MQSDKDSGRGKEKEDSSWVLLPASGSGGLNTIGSSWSKLPVGGNLENRPQNCPESGDAEPPGKAIMRRSTKTGSR